MKLFLTTLMFFFSINLSFSQDEVKQDSEGVISYFFNENGASNSIRLIGAKSQSLLGFEIDGDEVIIFHVNPRFIGWDRFFIDKSISSCAFIDGQSIGRKPRELRSKLAIDISKINDFTIVNAESKTALINVSFSDKSKFYTLEKLYENTVAQIEMRNDSPLTFMNGKVVRQ